MSKPQKKCFNYVFKPTGCFEKDTLFVEESFAINSIQDCSQACKATTCCKVLQLIICK